MIKTITAITLSLATVIAIAAEPQQHLTFVTTHQNEIGEVCPELKADQSLDFEFEANKDVEFNFHYHQDEQVTYPIEAQTLKSIKETFKAPIDQTYCLMWKGLKDKTNIKIKYFIR